MAAVNVHSTFFDGAPCIKLSKAYKAFMYFKFRTMINMMKDKSIDEVIGWKFLNKFTNGDTESLRPMIASLIDIAPYMTDESIKNENECCYTFDFPDIPEDVQKRMHFFYAKEEKAYKTCILHKHFSLQFFHVENTHHKQQERITLLQRLS